MPEFDLDNLKKTWQEQEVQPKYDGAQIEQMLNKSSRNYVKYILWISIAEFLVILAMNSYYVFLGDDSDSFMNILSKLGVQNTNQLEADYAHLYFVLKVISLLLTGVFVVLFWQNYKRINVESNLKKLILQIIKFKKTVNLFIFANIFMIFLFMGILTYFTFSVLSDQNIQLTNPTMIGFTVGIIVTMVLCVALIWIYYRIAYGIILKRLGKNLAELRKIEESE
ncbi:beta-carotene 15,15'-monooxygenase [Chryseobacterium suipulveris]|uniref:Beta-carotene 15,15'-monooxygenase n=1 Tax=Chryseobacterium suipulveris TaxID=2929800 RepID=A0ABY4BRQ4_9FLAO|nr:beta-carotene 15,15'-monooxygenase [Chryseobacterium suipulveris]UOE40393.1 beta-carotene 15,15'-monooxygenase [Chryseobacterium suipulveris]